MAITEAKADEVIDQLHLKGFKIPCHERDDAWPYLSFTLSGDGAAPLVVLRVDDNWGGEAIRDHIYPMVNTELGGPQDAVEDDIWAENIGPQLPADAPAEHIADAIAMWANDTLKWVASQEPSE